MSKPRVLIAITAIALVVPFAAMGQKAKPQVTATCTMDGDVDSRTVTVTVGRNVVSYGSADQPLFIDGSLLPPLGNTSFPEAVDRLRQPGPDNDGFYGPYYGHIRVLDNRLDYFFDTLGSGCGVDNTANRCPFRLVVADGTPSYIRIGKTRVLDHIAFAGGRTLLDYCDPNAADPANCWVRLYGCYDERDCAPDQDPVRATFDVKF